MAITERLLKRTYERWEYQVVKLTIDDQASSGLSGYGADGWRVIHASPQGEGVLIVVLERRR